MWAFFLRVSPALRVFPGDSSVLAIRDSRFLAIPVSWRFPCPGDSRVAIPHMSWRAVVWSYFNSMTLSKVDSWLLLVPPRRLVFTIPPLPASTDHILLLEKMHGNPRSLLHSWFDALHSVTITKKKMKRPLVPFDHSIILLISRQEHVSFVKLLLVERLRRWVLSYTHIGSRLSPRFPIHSCGLACLCSAKAKLLYIHPMGCLNFWPHAQLPDRSPLI